ncbi:hypothetical protein ACET3Z_006282 [Daucus carota]
MAAANALWQNIKGLNNTNKFSSYSNKKMINHTQLPNNNTHKNIISCSQASSSPAISTTTEFSSSSSSSSSQWPDFAKRVSGEWDGFGADFSPEGKPFELPENVVPEAYREWEVKVHDWQTQCPTLAEPEDLIAKYKLIKLLPTVGCEADAATRHSIDERHIGGAENNVSAFAYQSNGSYAAVWCVKTQDTYNLLELEHCLVHPQDQESRVRIIQGIRVENSKFKMQNIKVFIEQWYGPFRNGESLGGCSIRDTAFACTEALNSSEVAGIWQGLSSVAIFHNSQEKNIQEFVQNKTQNLTRDGSNLVLLPRKLWCSMKEDKGETHCEVGWLFSEGNAITSTCTFSSNAELKEIATSRETALPQ